MSRPAADFLTWLVERRRWLQAAIRHRLPSIVILLAAGGLIASISILWLDPFGQSEITDRSQVSSNIATVCALLAGIAAIAAASWFGSTDFKAEQATKEDITRLLAALRSIRLKVDAISIDKRPLESGLGFETERKIIDEFLSSTSGFAFWSWVSQDDVDHAWRRDFFYSITLLLATNQHGASIARDASKQQFLSSVGNDSKPEGPGTRARKANALEREMNVLQESDAVQRVLLRDAAFRLETLVSSLTATDVGVIGARLQDLPGAIADFRKTAPSAQIERYSRAADVEAKLALFQHLRDQGIADPTIELFVAVMEPGPETPERVERVRAALEAGADIEMTDVELLNRYSAQLKDFAR